MYYIGFHVTHATEKGGSIDPPDEFILELVSGIHPIPNPGPSF